MTDIELHEILDDENKKVTLEEFCQIIYELKKDCYIEYTKERREEEISSYNLGFYNGEINAFYIVLDLLEHLQKG